MYQFCSAVISRVDNMAEFYLTSAPLKEMEEKVTAVVCAMMEV